ncbi:MAG: hypothetical protein ABTQ31_15140 [Rhizobiaceae bacterium]
MSGSDQPEPRWRSMAGAPRDGCRILVTVRSVEQGPAEVDVAYWSSSDQAGTGGWLASDSYPGRVIRYAEPELKCWMPLPHASEAAVRPVPWDGDDEDLFDSGSGI